MANQEIIKAEFNQKLQAPSIGNGDNSYDLDEVISTYGLRKPYTYELIRMEFVTLNVNTLIISNGAFGVVTIRVNDGKNIVDAVTTLYGFNATIAQINAKNGFDGTKKAIEVAIKEYPTITSRGFEVLIANDIPAQF